MLGFDHGYGHIAFAAAVFRGDRSVQIFDGLRSGFGFAADFDFRRLLCIAPAVLLQNCLRAAVLFGKLRFRNLQFVHADLEIGDVLTVEYDGIFVGTPDVVKNSPHENTAWLAYGDDGETVKDTVSTVSYALEVLKYANGNVSLPLANAEFKLYRTRTGSEGAYQYNDPVKVHEAGEEDGKKVYTVCNVVHTDETSASTETLVTPENGTFIVYGLDLETYYLVETKAPSGYNPLEEGVVITMDVNHMTNARVYDVNINNNTGSILPDTGGIGTTIFYILGGVMVLGAVVLLITKKRMRADV